jgi:hypothetical protein
VEGQPAAAASETIQPSEAATPETSAEASSVEADGDKISSESAAAPPPEYINVDDFPYEVNDIVTGRVVFSNDRGARVALHGVKGVLGYDFSNTQRWRAHELSLYVPRATTAQQQLSLPSRGM